MAAAQDKDKKEGAAPAPAAQQSAPAEKMAPPAKMNNAAQDKKPAETATQAQKEPAKPMTPGAKAEPAKADAAKAAEKSGAEKSAAEQKSAPAAAQAKPDAAPPAAAATGAKPAAATTGQGAAGARTAVNLSVEQRTKIRTVITEKVHAQPVTNVNFTVSVGTKIPRTVHYYPLPVEVVEIYPAWRGYDFILVGNEIVVVDPATLEIVAIIEA